MNWRHDLPVPDMQPVHLPEALLAHARVWLLDLDLDAPVADIDWSLLDAAERAQTLRFYQRADRVRYSATRAALRRILGESLMQGPHELRFVAGPWGKPQLAQPCGADRPVTFNVSHSGAHSLIAVSDGRAIGVDIERRDTALDFSDIESKVFSPFELQLPRERQLDFFERWAAKEAVLKAVGVGVSEHLQNLSVERESMADADDCYGLHYAQPRWPVLKAWRLAVPAGYAAAVACEVNAADVRGNQSDGRWLMRGMS